MNRNQVLKIIADHRETEKILGIPRVELVLREGIKPALKEHILREAIHAA